MMSFPWRGTTPHQASGYLIISGNCRFLAELFLFVYEHKTKVNATFKPVKWTMSNDNGSGAGKGAGIGAVVGAVAGGAYGLTKENERVSTEEGAYQDCLSRNP